MLVLPLCPTSQITKQYSRASPNLYFTCNCQKPNHLNNILKCQRILKEFAISNQVFFTQSLYSFKIGLCFVFSLFLFWFFCSWCSFSRGWSPGASYRIGRFVKRPLEYKVVPLLEVSTANGDLIFYSNKVWMFLTENCNPLFEHFKRMLISKYKSQYFCSSYLHLRGF